MRKKKARCLQRAWLEIWTLGSAFRSVQRRRQQGRELTDGRAEITGLNVDHEVDGVEVPFATEAASEIGLGIDGGVEFPPVADRENGRSRRVSCAAIAGRETRSAGGSRCGIGAVADGDNVASW